LRSVMHQPSLSAARLEDAPNMVAEFQSDLTRPSSEIQVDAIPNPQCHLKRSYLRFVVAHS
jgi:hypothetical protein